MRQIAIYGKGGIGKSTIASSLAAALCERGHRVMQIGCDPKRDSTRNLTGGRMIPSVLDSMREQLAAGRDADSVPLEEVVFEGYRGVRCVESGGPEPGVGCAGRGVLAAISYLRDKGAFARYAPEVVLYDVLGDVVCGGFAQPIREGYAREIYLICTGEFMSLYAANNIARGITRLAEHSPSRLAGVICNHRGDEAFEDRVVAAFADRLGCGLIASVPRSQEIQMCEVRGQTVIQGMPDSPAATAFRDLADRLLANETRIVPAPLEVPELEELYQSVYASSQESAGDSHPRR
jgi:nitrogenase iron protein NifH